MSPESSHALPTIEVLRELAAVQGVAARDDDLEAVLGFLATILPALRELEAELPPDTALAGLYLPEGPV
jgi:hypothetical protein